MSVSTRSWAWKGRRKESIYQRGPMRSQGAELPRALSHCLAEPHHAGVLCVGTAPGHPAAALTAWCGAGLTPLHSLPHRDSGFRAGLAQNNQHTCGLRLPTPTPPPHQQRQPRANRTAELLMLEKTSKVIRSNHSPSTVVATTTPCPRVSHLHGF